MRSRRLAFLVWLAVSLGSAGCDSTTKFTDPTPASDQDDTPPPKASFDASLGYTGRFGAQKNRSDKRFRFDVSPYRDDAEKAKAEQLFPSHAAFLEANGDALPSAQTVVTAVKQLDDTIYAGVELAAQQGLGTLVEPKRQILLDAIAKLSASRSADGDAALVKLAAAVQLGGGTVEVPADLSAQVEQARQTFLAKPAEAKPIGFYTWSPDLQAVWQQDRLLQEDLPAGPACALACALASDAGLRDRYLNLLQLYTRLTNPLENSLAAALPAGPGAPCADGDPHPFLGPSRSAEVTLFRKLYPGGVPDNANLMDDLVQHIRSGDVSLAPQPGDGWYAYQTFALETLLVTDRSEERAKVAFTAKYKKHLREVFAAMLTQHRETHVKQLSRGMLAKAVPDTLLRVEPLATVFVRHARSYVFLEQALEPLFGAGWLDQAPAVGEHGAEQETLRQRIHRARDLYFGMYVLAAQDLGLRWRLDQPGDPAVADAPALASKADTWLQGLGQDPLAQSDVRVMVPIADLGGGRYKYWAVIGVRSTLADYAVLGDDDKPLTGEDNEQRAPLPTEQFLEVDSSATPLSRDEFRALCDQAKTADAIRAALEQR